MKKLSVTLLSCEGAIMEAIAEAKRLNKKIVKLGIPPKIQAQLSALTVVKRYDGKPAFLELYGIKVEKTKTLQITTEISRFNPRGI